jgi:hypothetical protein
MWTPSVVKIDISADRLACLANAVVGFEVHPLVFDGAPEPLDEHIVSPCAFAVQADRDIVRNYNVRERLTRKLAALIRVEDLWSVI